jgi:hypothetical protein
MLAVPFGHPQADVRSWRQHCRALFAVPVIKHSLNRLCADLQMLPVDLAKRAQIGKFTFGRTPFMVVLRWQGFPAHRLHGSLPGPRAGFFEEHVGVLLRLGQDLVAAVARFLGQTAAVGLCVSHVAVGRELCRQKDAHSMGVSVVFPEKHGIVTVTATALLA